MDKATLHVVTVPSENDRDVVEIEVVEHDDSSYICDCAACLAEKANRVKLGVRRTPAPFKRAA